MTKRLLAALAFLLASSACAVDLPTLGVVIRASDASAPYSPTQLNSVLFGSVAGWWRPNTYNRLNIVGTTHPTVLVSAYSRYSNRLCGYYGMQEVRALLTKAGVDLSKYKLIVAVHTSEACGYKGVGMAGYVAMNGTLAVYHMAHEIGHTQNLRHANSLRYSTVKEYGFDHDIMGQGHMGNSNVIHKLAVGAIDDTRIAVHDAPVGEPRTYTVAPLSAWSGIVGLRLAPKSALPMQYAQYESGISWIEYRQNAGLDATTNSAYWPLFAGAIVLRVGMSGQCAPCIVDTHPASSDYRDAPVFVGERFMESGHLIETLSADASGVTVRVTRIN